MRNTRCIYARTSTTNADAEGGIVSRARNDVVNGGEPRRRESFFKRAAAITPRGRDGRRWARRRRSYSTGKYELVRRAGRYIERAAGFTIARFNRERSVTFITRVRCARGSRASQFRAKRFSRKDPREPFEARSRAFCARDRFRKPGVSLHNADSTVDRDPHN